MVQQRYRDETDLLYIASNQLTYASSPLEQLEAVSDYARSQGANRGILVYCEYEGDDRIDEIIAEGFVKHFV